MLAVLVLPITGSPKMYCSHKFSAHVGTSYIYPNKFVPITTIILPKIDLEHFELLRPWEASEPAPWRPQVYMTVTWTHSALKPLGAKNCLDTDILKKCGKSKWRRFFYIAHEKGFEFNAQPQTCMMWHVTCWHCQGYWEWDIMRHSLTTNLLTCYSHFMKIPQKFF